MGIYRCGENTESLDVRSCNVELRIGSVWPASSATMELVTCRSYKIINTLSEKELLQNGLDKLLILVIKQ